MESVGILSLIATYGTPAVVVIIILYILYLLLTNFVSSGIKGWFTGETKREEKNKNELKLHTFFNNAEYRIAVEIPALDLIPDKPVKEKMYKDLIITEMKVIYDICREIIAFDMNDWTPAMWQNEISKKVTEMISTFAKKAKDNGIPDIVIVKYNRWNMSSFEMLYEYIKILASSTTYPDNMSRTNTLLIMMTLLLVTIVADAEKSLSELNGEVAGKEYKGMKLED